MMELPDPKPVIWIGSSRRDFRASPEQIKSRAGYALYVAQLGDKHRDAKPLKGFGGAGVVEIVADHGGDTFRAVYTVRFAAAVYVLHVFQKKAKQGRATPKFEMKLIEQRLRQAEQIEREEQ
jgi:phage-related protein